jgi:predicted amidohydrolase YtcJ
MPDTIFYNGTILTMDPARPRVGALSLRGGKILELGDGVQGTALSGTRRVDLAGRCLLPGFHDSHVHLTQHGFELSQLKLADAPSLEQALTRVAERAQAAEPGTWLVGAGFSTARWSVTSLDKGLLDKVAPHHPVYLRSQDHHSAWVNSLALAAAGITRDTPDPRDGVIVRDQAGEATGMLLELAQRLVGAAVPAPSDEDIRRALELAGEDLARLGITCVHHMNYEPAAYWRELALAASRQSYPLRVWACINQDDIEAAAAIGLATGQGGDRFTVGGAKFFADGALGSLTAWMLEPYGGPGNTGMAVHGPEVLAERLPKAIAAGLTPVVHAIGDAANRAVIGALEANLPALQAAGLRPRVEHVQHLHPDDLERLARLGAIASVQAYHLVFDAKRISELLGDRLGRAYPIRSLLAAGAHLAFGSDTPVADPDVRLGLRAATERRGEGGETLTPDEAIGVQEALAAYTRGAAFAIGREARSGQLKEGFDADLVVLSHNPLESLDGLEVLGTMLAGRWTRELEG